MKRIIVTGFYGLDKKSIIADNFSSSKNLYICKEFRTSFHKFSPIKKSHLLTKEDFFNMILEDKIEEWELVDGVFCGISKAFMKMDCNSIVVTSPNIAKQIKRKYNDVFVLFLTTDSCDYANKLMANNKSIGEVGKIIKNDIKNLLDAGYADAVHALMIDPETYKVVNTEPLVKNIKTILGEKNEL